MLLLTILCSTVSRDEVRRQERDDHSNCEINIRGGTIHRFIDASIYRDTFPAIRIAILFFIITIFFWFFFLIFFFHNDFHLGRKDT